jgi:hypothetical protein
LGWVKPQVWVGTKIGCVPKMKGLSLPPTTWNVKFTLYKNHHECTPLTCTRHWQKHKNVKQQTEDLWNLPSQTTSQGRATQRFGLFCHV